MLQSLPRSSMKTATMWYILSAIFFAIGIVSALGEWVFHWWRDPGQWSAVLGIGLGVLTFFWGASARDVDRLREDLRELRLGQAEQTGMLREMRDAQRENTALLGESASLLREVVASFRRQ